MSYLSNIYFFAGEDLSACKTSQDFVNLLCKKANVNSKGISAPSFDNSHSQYVIASLKVSGANAKNQIKGILKWFWDPKGQMLRFKPINN